MNNTLRRSPWHRYRRRHYGQRGARGFTLIEILVAGAIFVVLGLGLITVLHGSLSAWRAAETTRDAYDRATAVLELVERDLRAIAIDLDREPPGAPRLRVEIGYDVFGQSYLVAVRHLPPEGSQAITRLAGASGLQGQGGRGRAAYDRYYRPHGMSARLRGIDGYAEVAYAFGPKTRERIELPDGDTFEGELYLDDDGGGNAIFRTTEPGTGRYVQIAREVVQRGERTPLGSALYRGLLAPIAGPRSLLADFAALPTTPDPEAWAQQFTQALDEKFAFVSDGILYLGFAASVGGGAFIPDPMDQNPVVGAAFDSLQDGMPSAIRVTLVVEAINGRRRQSKLARPLEPLDEEIELTRAESLPDPADGPAFIKIGDEWIRFEQRDGSRLSDLTRGLRGTLAPSEAYPKNTPVRWGWTFTKLVRIGGGP